MLSTFEAGTLVFKFVHQPAKSAVFMLVLSQYAHEFISTTIFKIVFKPSYCYGITMCEYILTRFLKPLF